ncbi:unnamed protein product [Mortierella alpina]
MYARQVEPVAPHSPTFSNVSPTCAPSSPGPASPSPMIEPVSWCLGDQTSKQYSDKTFGSYSCSNSNGPIIVDLSSGEELVALHLGENDHKRRRDSTEEPALNSPIVDSLRTIYEFQDEGSLVPILVRCPTRSFAVKKLRLGKLYDIQRCGS